jgi:hypothetical protein
LFEEKNRLFYCFSSKKTNWLIRPSGSIQLRGEISGVLPQKQWNWDVVIL